MATEEVVVVVSERGAAKTADAIRGIGTASKESSSALDTLKGALAAVGGFLAVSKLKEYSDTYTGLYARLKLVTKGNQELADTEKLLYNISQDTRSSFEGTAALYTKLSLNAKNLNVSQKTIADTVRTVNEAIILSGASANEAKGGLIQFSQGLASGKLQGEELRSVLENLPFLALQIAKGLNTTVDNLRKMGAAGTLTTNQVIGALQRQKDEIEGSFKSFQPTISQSIQVLENAFTRFIGQAGQGSGAAKSIADAIKLLADNMNLLANTALTVAAAFAVFKFAQFVQGVYSAVTAVGALNAIMALNPFVAVATAIGTIIAALLIWGDNLVVIKEKNITLRDVVVESFKVMIGWIGSAWQKVKDAGDALYMLGVIIDDKIGNAVNTVRGYWNGLIAFIQSTWATVLGFFQNLGASIMQTFKDVWDFVVRSVEAPITKIKQVIDLMLTALGLQNKLKQSNGGTGVQQGPPGFATGGSFMVGGAGGTDSQLVQFMATPGERVTVETPKQQAGQTVNKLMKFANGGSFTVGGSGGGPGATTVNLNLDARESFYKALSDNKKIFADATKLAVDIPFKKLTNETSAVSQDVTKGTDKIFSGVASYGGNITEVLNESYKGQNDGFKNTTDGTDRTTAAVERLNGAVIALGQQQGSGGGGGGGRTSDKFFGDTNSLINGSGSGFSTPDGRPTSGGGSFTILTIDSFDKWLQKIGGQTTKDPVGKKLQTLVYDYASAIVHGASPEQLASMRPKIKLYKSGFDDARGQDLLGSVWRDIQGFRTGGSMMVTGSGASDQELIALRASAGERVDVKTQEQQRREKEMMAAVSKPKNVNVTVQVNGVTDANSFRKNEGQMLRQFAQKLGRALEDG